MAIRLAALDVDGTLLAPDNSITPATRQAIHEAKDAGLEIVVCTGRSFVEVQDILRQLPEVRYLSCGTGAYALDVWTMEMLYECSMPSELGKAAYRAVAQADCMVHFYTGLSVRHSRWCMDHFSDYMEEKMRPLMEKTHIIEDDLDAYVENSHDPVYKLYVTFPRKEEYDKAYNAVKDLPVFLTDGGWAIDLEVMSRDTDKGVALKALAERLLERGLHHVRLCLPYSMGGMVDTLHSQAKVLSCRYEAEGILVEAIMDETLYGRLLPYVTE